MKRFFNLVLIFICFTFLSCDKKDGMYYYEKGSVLVNEGKTEEGRKVLKKAENFFSPETYQWKEIVVLEGESYLWEGRKTEAKSDFERVFTKASDDEDVILNIVATCLRTENPEVAREFLEEKLEIKVISNKTRGVLYYYLSHIAFSNEEYGLTEKYIENAKKCFLEDGSTQYDEQMEKLLSKIPGYQYK